MKRLMYLVLFLVVVVFAMTLYQKNPDPVIFKYYFGIEHELSLYLLVVITFVVGMLFGVLLTSFSIVKNKVHAGKSKRALAKVEREVEALRAAPPNTNH